MLKQYIDNVPKAVRNRPAWGEALRKRREELGLTQEQVSELTVIDGGEPLLSQAMVSSLETGPIVPTQLRSDRFFALLQALRWTPEEFSQATGLELPLLYQPSGKPLEEVVYMPVVASGTAGRPWPNEGTLPVPRSLVRPGSILIRVEGDSMDSGDESGLRDGDLVLVDQSLQDLKPGKVYALEILGDGIAIKRAISTKKGWIFVSDNPRGPVLEPDEVVVLGEVYRKISIREVK